MKKLTTLLILTLVLGSSGIVYGQSAVSDKAAEATLGATGDAAATVGGTGTISSKLRELSSQLAAIALDATVATANTALGTPSDAAASAGGTGSISAKLREISNQLANMAVTVTGTVTANAGTNLNTSLLALETGGNLANLATAIGAVADAASTAGGTGTLSAKLREISSQLSSLTVTLGASSSVIGHVICDAGCSSSSSPSYGAAFPATGTPVGFKNGSGNLDYADVDGSHHLNVDVVAGLPADADKGNARTTAPVPNGCEATGTFIANNQMGVLRCNPATLGLYTERIDASGNSSPAMDAAARAGFQKLTDGTNTAAVDPCQDSALTKTNFNVRVASASLTQLIAAQSSKTTYICWMKIHADGTTETASVVEAAHTTTACDGSQTALEGSTTAASGIALGANGGSVVGTGGFAAYKTTAAAHEVCALNVGTNPVHFSGQWVAR